MQYRIWANHAHVFPEGAKPNGQIHHLKEIMQECNIEKTVCFTCFENQFKRANLPGDENSWLYNEIKNDSSLIGFGTINFDKDDIREQVQRIVSYGFKGIKLHPAYQEFHILGEKPRIVYEEAQKSGLFLSFHTGFHWHRLSDYHPLLFDELAWDYPELKFSMEHIGGYHFFKDALAVMCNNARRKVPVYAGWTSIAYSPTGIPDAWSISDEELKTVIAQTGNNKSIFGLDFPFKDAAPVHLAINRIIELDIPEEAKIGVLGKNLATALNMEWD